MATIKDVAAEAGVSCATVSNYLNGTKPISAARQKRIDEAIKKLNYVPSFSARTLKRKLSNDIGVILPDFGNPYYVQVLQGIEPYFCANGFLVNISLSNNIPEFERKAIDGLLGKQAAGIMLVTCQPNNMEYFYQNIIKKNKPLVLIDRQIKGLITNHIYFNNEETVYKLVCMCIQKGYRKIAILAGPDAYTGEHDAIQGYIRALRDNGIKLNEKFISNAVITKESAFVAAVDILSSGKPDAIITTAVNFAAGIIEALQFNGFTVPDDVFVISLGEDTWCADAYDIKVFCTKRQPITLGKKAAMLLHEQIASPVTFEPKSVEMKDRFNSYDYQHKTEKAYHYSAKKEHLKVIIVKSATASKITGLLPNFKNRTGIDADVEIFPHKDYLERLQERLKGDDAPDVFMVDMPWLYSLVENEVVADITDFLASYNFDRNIYLPNCFEYLSEYKGRYYGLPFICVPQLLYYRKDLFSDKALSNAYEQQVSSKLCPPRTWTEFNAIARFFTRSRNPNSPTEYGISIPGAFHECLSSEIRIRMRAYGARICDDNLRICFNSSLTLKAFVHLISVLECCPENFHQKDRDDIVMDFVSGKTAMLVTFQSILPFAERSDMANKIDVAQIPGRRSILGGWSL